MHDEAKERPRQKISPYPNKSAETVGHVVSSGGECTGHRMSAQNVLREKIKRANRDLQALEILERVIPWNILNEEIESRLWDFFSRYKCHMPPL